MSLYPARQALACGFNPFLYTCLAGVSQAQLPVPNPPPDWVKYPCIGVYAPVFSPTAASAVSGQATES